MTRNPTSTTTSTTTTTTTTTIPISIPPNISSISDISSIAIHFNDPNVYDNVIVQDNEILLSLRMGGDDGVANPLLPSVAPTSATTKRKLPTIRHRRRRNHHHQLQQQTPTSVPKPPTAPLQKHHSTPTSTPSIITIKSPMSGIIQQHNLKKIAPNTYQLQDVSKNWILQLAPCPHTVVYSGHCALCGDRVQGQRDLQNFKKMDHANQNLLIEEELAKNIGTKERERLFKQRKLSLVLDLDHTLFHATPDPKLGPFLDQYRYFHNGENPKDILQFFLTDSNGMPSQFPHYVKLRPHLAEFLEEASKWFELHIVTHGTKVYAKAMSKIIDPTKKYFSNRIIAREDCEKVQVKTGAKCFTELNLETGQYELTQGTTNKWTKTISHLFPQGVHTVLIIDDTLDVWREEFDNVLQIKPYHFFVGSKDVNNAAGTKVKATTGGNKSALNTPEGYYQHINKLLDHDTDRELLIHLDVLKRIHENFFEKLDALKAKETAKRHRMNGGAAAPNAQQAESHNIVIHPSIMPHANDLLSREKRTTFEGCHFLFSRIFPLHQNPKQTPIWRDATNFGATCHTDFNDRITHVITNQRGTSKVRTALKTPGVFVVHLNWFFDSKFRFKAQNEFDYLMYSNETVGGKTPVHLQYRPNNGEKTTAVDEEILNDISVYQNGAQDLIRDMHQFRMQLGKLKRYSLGDDDALDVRKGEEESAGGEKNAKEEAMEEEGDDFDALFDEEFDKVMEDGSDEDSRDDDDDDEFDMNDEEDEMMRDADYDDDEENLGSYY